MCFAMDDQLSENLLPSRLLLALQQEPDATVVYFRGQPITRRQLLSKVARLSTLLGHAGFGKDMVVGVCLPRSPELLVVLLALWSCGVVYLPIDSSLPLQRVQDCVEQARAEVLLVQKGLEEICERLALPMMLVQPMCFTEHDDTAPALPLVDLQEDDLAYILFTSGSSGLPKGVPISHGNLATLFNGCLPLIGLETGWRYLACSSLYFDVVFFELLAPLLMQGQMVLADEDEFRQPEALLDLIRNHRIDVVQATPAMWLLLMQAGLCREDKLALALSSGEALSINLARRMLPCCHSLWNLYGPTECTLWASAHAVQASDLEVSVASIPIGTALPAYSLSLLPVDEALLDGESDLETGELLITGKAVSPGYLQGSATVGSAFATSPSGQRQYRTGDLCRRDASGNYHYLQRLDKQMKVNGHRIEAAEIEMRLEQHPSIRQALCIARTSSEGVGQLFAFVVCEPSMPNKDKQRWNRHLAAWLPEWMLPQRYFILDTLPLNGNGKVDRKALLSLAEPLPRQAHRESDTLEGRVTGIFCDILELPDIGPCDSFFDAGGSSMLSAALVLAINQHFDCKLSLREFLAVPPTVDHVCKLLQTQQPGINQ
jgi:amino acid adenylation domain-containing protein